MDHGKKFRGVVEERIQEAISRGVFKNLPGKGKPLKLDNQTFVDPEMRLAYRMLRNAGMVPAWLEKQKDLRLEIERARIDLRRSLAHAKPEQSKSIRNRFRDDYERINHAIRAANLEAPLPSLQVSTVNVEREFAAALAAVETKKDQPLDWS
jgi:hypothetical protein